MTDVFALEKHTQIDQTQSYIRAYPYLLASMNVSQILDESSLVCGAHMVYGWMPTIVEIHATDCFNAQDGAALLNKARAEGALSDDEIAKLAGLINRSVVGASKLLHFVNPEAFAIWDSRIYRFLFQKTAHQYRVNNAAEYQRYLILLRRLQKDPRFLEFHASINKKMGYQVSALRALEVVMFMNAIDMRAELPLVS